jgi:hypothetical protein
MAESRMDDKVDGICKEVAVSQSRYWLGICPEGTEESHGKPEVTIGSIPVENRTGGTLYTSLKSSC